MGWLILVGDALTIGFFGTWGVFAFIWLRNIWVQASIKVAAEEVRKKGMH